jgi:hypothetical protein
MPFARRTTPARHLAGAPRAPWTPAPADFDVDAAFEPDFDFDALFAADDADAEAPPAKVRIPRQRVAFALCVTLAATPLLFLDNFQATASTPSRVTAGEHPSALAATAPSAVPADITTAPTTAPSSTLPQAVVFVAAPTTTSTVAPATTTTDAPVTTTTAKPKVVAAVKPAVVVTTTTTTPTAPPVTTTAPAPKAAVSADPNAESTWDALAKCESGGNWASNTGNGYYGGLQFSLSTWQGLGGTGYPYQASKATQIAMGKKLYARSGWAAWPGCARKLGYS